MLKHEFHHPIHDREPGEDFFRLASISKSGTLVLEITPTPPAFETDPETIKSLGSWFSESSNSRIPELMPQRQQISSIQPGMTLHINANVDSVDTLDLRHFTTTKNKRFKHKSRRQLGCYATLSDSSGVVTLFLGQRYCSLVPIIQSAHRNHRGVSLTHVRATTSNNDDGTLLKPTNSSGIELINPVERQSSCSIPNEATQSCVYVRSDHAKADEAEEAEVKCTIRDIIINGVSLANQKHIYLNPAHNAELLCNLLCRGDRCYNDATLELTESSSGKILTANAEGRIVEKLLGDVSAEWKGNVKLQKIITSLLHGMLEESLEFVWKLEFSLNGAESEKTVRVRDVRLAVLQT